MWEDFKSSPVHDQLGIRLDVSRASLDEHFLESMKEPCRKALAEMRHLEGGAIANPDENRMVGHYWLRAPDLAPEPSIAQAIRKAVEQVTSLARRILAGEIKPPEGGPQVPAFKRAILIGIGGSALGPQLLIDAIGQQADGLEILFLDNTDPDGFDNLLERLGTHGLAESLVIIISKSGGTKETRNGMLEVEAALQHHGLALTRRAIAVTMEDSPLAETARQKGFLSVLPIWEWVGGRTSVTSAVGLLPLALAGLDTEAFLEGARLMDEWTRTEDLRLNPAMLQALAWYRAGEGRGKRNLVILPYKDRLLLLSRYLQQLVMESIGKEKDRKGRVVRQGLTVYGNKGSTDQHAFVQQLREGPDDFFVTFVQVLRDREGSSIEVEPEVTSGDYLLGFLMGTREALSEKNRLSISLTVERVDERTLGAMIALFERTVGFYASLIDVNAYHQPGVEAGKKAAAAVLSLQRRILAHLSQASALQDAEAVASALEEEDTEAVFLIMEHLAANGRLAKEPGPSWWQTRFGIRR